MIEPVSTQPTSRFPAALAFAIATTIAAAAIAWLFFGGSGDEGGAEELGPLDSFKAEVGSPAPDFALLDVRDGKTVRRLSDYRGKVVVLNWFASWCGPCAREMPDFEEAYQALGGDVVFLGVNLMEPRETAAKMLEDLGVTYPAVLDSEGKVAEAYRVQGMPTTYFIDRDGTVRAAGTGLVTQEALRAELAKLGVQYE